MNFSVWMILGLVVFFLGLLILVFRFVGLRKRVKAAIQVRFEGIRKVIDRNEAFLQVDLKIINTKEELIRIGEIQ